MAPALVLAQGASQLLAQGAQAAGLVLGVMMVREQLMPQPPRMSKRDSHVPSCPRCNGSGREECFCNRWSDGDVGCSSCVGTGMTACRSCGGSGTGRPIPVKLRVDRR
eukprot:jgi/Chlat1/8797/Chrsp90S08117